MSDSDRSAEFRHGNIKRVATNTIGIDYQWREIYRLQQLGYDVRFADAQNFDLNTQFDTIIASEVIEHLTNPGLFLDCCKRHLAPDGLLLITTPNAFGLEYAIQNLLFGKEHLSNDHPFIMSRCNVEVMLGRHGFQLQEFKYFQEDSSLYYRQPGWKIYQKISWCLQRIAIAMTRKELCKGFAFTAKVRKL